MTKKNNWWLMTVYAVVAILIVAIVACCFIQKSYRPEIDEPHSFKAQLVNQAEYILCDKDNTLERYNEVNDEFNKSFNENVLTSIFSGRLGYNSRINYENSLPTFSGYKMTITFATSQTIKLNGKTYNPVTNTQETIEYVDIILNVVEGKGFTQHYLYYVYDYIDNANIQKTGYYRQTVMANFDELYNLLASY